MHHKTRNKLIATVVCSGLGIAAIWPAPETGLAAPSTETGFLRGSYEMAQTFVEISDVIDPARAEADRDNFRLMLADPFVALESQEAPLFPPKDAYKHILTPIL